MKASDKRRARAQQIRDEADGRDARELERLKERLRSIPPGQCTFIWEPEAHILLDALESQNNTKRGSPALLAEHHRRLAVHYHWLRGRGTKQDDAVAMVSDCWGLSEDSVKKFERQYKKTAMPTVSAFLAEPSEKAPQANIEMWALAFRKLSP